MGGKVATYIRLEKDDREWFEKLAAKEKRTLSAMLRVVLEQYRDMVIKAGMEVGG